MSCPLYEPIRHELDEAVSECAQGKDAARVGQMTRDEKDSLLQGCEPTRTMGVTAEVSRNLQEAAGRHLTRMYSVRTSNKYPNNTRTPGDGIAWTRYTASIANRA